MSEDLLNENGLTVKNANDIRAELVDGYQNTYGSDINLDSNTQDGQLVDLITQINTDIRETIMDVYNSMNPDMVRGRLQDIRFRLNNLFRKEGSFTIIPMTLTITQTVSLEGLDANYNDINATAYGFTDNSGNIYYLIDSETFTAGTYTRSFRANNQGDINPAIGTVVNPLTIVKGVQSGINEAAAITIGTNEESDEEFAQRRQRSIELGSQNSSDGLQGQLLELEGVTQAFVYNHDYENYPDGVDADGIPLHYIWVIVEGGSNADIGEAIYKNIGGAGTKGDITISTLTVNGNTFTAHFDRVEGVPLYIRFDLRETEKNTIFDINAIKNYIVENLTYETNEFAETSKVTQVCRDAISSTSNTGIAINVEISKNGEDWVDFATVDNKKQKFTVDPTRINITEIDI